MGEEQSSSNAGIDLSYFARNFQAYSSHSSSRETVKIMLFVRLTSAMMLFLRQTRRHGGRYWVRFAERRHSLAPPFVY